LSTQFKRWAESENAYNDVALLRELILKEQFTSHLDSSMRGWLIDQKPDTLSQLSRFADQYVAVHQTDRFVKGSQNPRGNYSPKKPGHGNFHQAKAPSQQSEQSQEAGSKP